MASRVLTEVCVESAADARAAAAGGADRVELCAALELGGVTPSSAMVEAAVATGVPVVVLVRPRAGDFLYSADELAVIRRDVECARVAGAVGVAVGVLTAAGEVDVGAMRSLVDAARPLQVTCHRAFDMTAEPNAALDALVELGVERVLTSGQRATAPEGAELLAALVARAGNAISIMPGCGVRAHNVADLVDATGAREVHFSAGETEASAMTFVHDRCAMGRGSAGREYDRTVTSATRVAAVVDALAARGR